MDVTTAPDGEPDDPGEGIRHAFAVWRRMLHEAKLRSDGFDPEDPANFVGDPYKD